MSPSATLTLFNQDLAHLEAALRQILLEMEIMIGGHFNAKSYAWGSAYEDTRGQSLVELMVGLVLAPANVGSTPTFERQNAESVIEVTFNRENSCSLKEWKVSCEYSGSDHRYISFVLEEDRTASNIKQTSDES